jgi:hypothetical protein
MIILILHKFRHGVSTITEIVHTIALFIVIFKIISDYFSTVFDHPHVDAKRQTVIKVVLGLFSSVPGFPFPHFY